MARYEYRTTTADGDSVLFTAQWLVPQDDAQNPVLHILLCVQGYEKAYFVNLPEAETTKLAQIVAEGAF